MKAFLITEDQIVDLINEYTDRQSVAFDKWYNKIGGDPKDQDNLKTLFFKLSKRLIKKDIFQYSSVEELLTQLKGTQQNLPTMKKIKMSEEGTDYLTIFNNSKVRIIVPITHAGSCKHGLDTKWCTAQKGFPLYFTTHVADGFLYRIIYKELEAKRSFQSKGETVVNNINEKYSLYINNKGVQKLVDFNDKKVDFEDLPFFTDEMENAIVKHYKTNIHKIEDNDILTKWLEN